MKLGDMIKCPKCNNILKDSSIKIKRINIRNESDQLEDYFAGDEEKLCRKTDNIFATGYCENCQNNIELMILVDVKPTKCYSADNRSDLIMIDE